MFLFEKMAGLLFLAPRLTSRIQFSSVERSDKGKGDVDDVRIEAQMQVY